METQEFADDETRESFLVIDIETAPQRSSPIPVLSGELKRTTLSHDITAVAMLVASRSDGPAWVIEKLYSWDNSRKSEFEILRELNRKLVMHLGGNTTVVTFNGLRHDVPTIRRRAAFHRMFELSSWASLQHCPHRDLMISGIGGSYGQWASLKDTCDSLLIPTDSNFPKAALATANVARRKCETDICSTFALLLYALAMDRADGRELSNGWRALADFVIRVHATIPHLMQFAYAAEDLGL